MTAHRSIFRWTLGLIAGPLLLSSCIDFNNLFRCDQSSRGQTPLPVDAFAPNGSIPTAVPMPAELNATLFEGDKPDHFKFDAKALERVKWVFKYTSGLYLNVRLDVVDLNGLVVGGDSDFSRVGSNFEDPVKASRTLELVAPKDGTYVARVAGQYSGPADSMCSRGQLAYNLSFSRIGTLNDPVVIPSEITTSSVKFSWNPVEGASGYVIELQEGSNWIKPLKLPATATSGVYQLDYPKVSSVITYRVRTIAGQTSSLGTLVSVTTPTN
jgi:hypothetical protein